jgi:protein-disulfide isomerase
MKKARPMLSRLRLATMALALLVAAPSVVQSVAQAPLFNEAQRRAMGEIIKDYLIKNPEVLAEAMAELEKRQKDAERDSRLRITQDKNGPLFSSKYDINAGNTSGDVTLVEFFDYNCGFCKRGMADLQKLIGEDKNLRIVAKDFPVLGQGSVEAATVAVALKQQLPPDKLWAFHTKLLSARGTVGRQQALDAAREQGADMTRLAKDIDSAEVRGAIEQNIQLADSLGISGTPTYVIGDELIVGAVGFADLKARVDNVRKCGKAAC